MGTQEWINLIACVGELAISLMVPLCAHEGRLAAPLILLSVDFFLWSFAQLAAFHSRWIGWHLLDMTASALAIALAFHFFLRFLGRARRSRRPLLIAYGYTGLLALTAAGGLFWDRARALAFSSLWSWAWLAGLFPLAIAVGIMLIAHGRHAGHREERNRARLLLVAVAVVVPLGSTEVWADLGFRVMHLGSVGVLTFNALLLLAALRFRLLDRKLTPSVALGATIMSAIAGVAYLTMYRAVGTNKALFSLGTLMVALLLLASVRMATAALTAHRDQTARLVTLGRMAAQMGHDLKNPLAALKGAAQYLREERSQGRSIDDKNEFLKLIVDQIDRMKDAVDKYARLGRIEAMCRRLQINELVTDLVTLQGLGNAAGGAVAIKADLAADLPPCWADRELVSRALENLLQNAFEAAPRNAQVVVRTALTMARHARGVTISVEDTGPGMSPRVRERALDDFFTTKQTGSGLGLAFVRRVAEAHGGEVSLSSKEGVGTTVRLFFPLGEPT
jgi:signal transduction histidine kinase